MRLANGVRVLAIPVAGTAFVEIAIAVRSGSRYEAEGQAGISHLLEHLLFRGSRAYPSSHALNHALESLGDGLEGGTGREHSVYSIGVPSAHVRRVLSILADVFSRPLLRDLRTEKAIILEEMLEELDEKGRENDPFNVARSLVFGQHPLGRPVLGRKPSLLGITRRDLLTHLDRFYRPEDFVVVAAGAVDPDEFALQVDRTLGRMPARRQRSAPSRTRRGESAGKQQAPSGLRLEPGRLPCGEVGPRIRFIPQASSQLGVMISFVARGERSSDFIHQTALERILDDGLSSRLQRSLCERRGLLYDVRASLEGYSDVGLMDFEFRAGKSHALAALGEFLVQLRRLRERLVGTEEIRRVKARMLRDSVALFESPRALAHRMAEAELLGLATPRTAEDWRRAIAAITSARIRETAREIFVPGRMVAVFEGKVTRAQRARIERLLQRQPGI